MLDQKSAEAVNALIRESLRARGTKAQQALVDIGTPSVRPVIEAINNTKEKVCLFSVLGEIGSQAREAIPALEKALNANSELDRLHAAWAIIKIDSSNKSVEPVLKAALVHREVRIRLIAAEAATQSVYFRNRQSLQVLLDVIADMETQISSYDRATVLVARFGPNGKDALPLLNQELRRWKATEPVLGVYVAAAIAKIDPKNMEVIHFLNLHREVLESIAQNKKNDRLFVQFANEILGNIRQSPKR